MNETIEHTETQRTDSIVIDGDSVTTGYCSKEELHNM